MPVRIVSGSAVGASPHMTIDGTGWSAAAATSGTVSGPRASTVRNCSGVGNATETAGMAAGSMAAGSGSAAAAVSLRAAYTGNATDMAGMAAGSGSAAAAVSLRASGVARNAWPPRRPRASRSSSASASASASSSAGRVVTIIFGGTTRSICSTAIISTAPTTDKGDGSELSTPSPRPPSASNGMAGEAVSDRGVGRVAW